MEPKSPPKKKTKTSDSGSVPSGAEGGNHNGRDDSAEDAEHYQDETTDNSDPPAPLPRTRTCVGQLVGGLTIQGLHVNPGSPALLKNPEQELDVRQRWTIGSSHVVGLFTMNSNELAGNVGMPFNFPVHELLTNIKMKIKQEVQVIGKFTGDISNVAKFNGQGVKKGDPIGGILRIFFYTTDDDAKSVELHLKKLFPPVGDLQLVQPE